MVFLSATGAEHAMAAGRSTQKRDINTDNVRVAAPVRNGATRAATVDTTTRSATSATRNANTTNRGNGGNVSGTVVSRGGNTSSVVSRGKEKTRGNVVIKPRTRTIDFGENIEDNYHADVVGHNITTRAAIKSDNKKITAQDVADAKELLEQTASLNKSCQDQYNECMDQFCAVVDSNQKRCSCSANLSKYSGVQEAVTKANDELNEVAQRIRYVGLSADEIRAIMTETEAEAELSGKKDNSETRNMLNRIEALIKDPTTSTTTTSLNDFSLDSDLNLDLDFSENSADIFSLSFMDTESESISNKRGTALYNAARKRCKTILTNCKEVGATSTQITGNYDLAIDKDCIAYEQGLKKMNQTLQSNVRSAGLMLQKARLAVLQNKNQYDIKGCMGALESCMTDDMVCGADYEKCLDPTKKYIDENGKVVLGQDITSITRFMQNFNAAVTSDKLAEASATTINDATCSDDGSCVMKYLLTKIGTGNSVKDGGLCRAVLDKCQQYTYKGDNSAYIPFNDVVVNYIQRAMVNIKSSQHKIISDYASTCMTEVASCYNQQVSQVNSWSSSASVSSIKSVMTGACRNVALTCSYSVFANLCAEDASNLTSWVLKEDSQQTSGGEGEQNPSSSCTPCDKDHQTACLEGISGIFYQSLLCPENSTYAFTSDSSESCSSTNTYSSNRMKQGCVNTQCKCNAGYTSWNGSCLASCADTEYRDDYGVCQKCTGTDRQLGGGTVNDGVVTGEYNKCETVTSE